MIQVKYTPIVSVQTTHILICDECSKEMYFANEADLNRYVDGVLYGINKHLCLKCKNNN